MSDSSEKQTGRDGGVVVIGAGCAGMTAAFELSREGRPVVVLEKSDAVGGLARTYRFGEFLTDIGPHRFFTKRASIRRFVEELLGDKWGRVDRHTRFYIDGRMYRYPIELTNVVSNMGLLRSGRIVWDYLLQLLLKPFKRTEPASFGEKVIQDFGRSLAELSLLNYTRKIWGLPCRELSADWAKQRIKDLSIKEILAKIFTPSRSKARSFTDYFFYPEQGTGMICETMRQRVAAGAPAFLKPLSRPRAVRHDGKTVTAVEADVNGTAVTLSPAHLISTMPLTEFLRLLDPPPPAGVLEAAGRLRFRSHVSLFITLRKPSVFPDQWLYFPGEEIPFGRISEPRNFSPRMAPEGRTSLLVEFFCWHGDEIWNSDAARLLEISLPWLTKLGFLTKEEIVEFYVHREEHAYPVYTLGYREPLDRIQDFLLGFDNLQCTGRNGIFIYTNQDHSIAQGWLAARNILDGTRFDCAAIGMEDGYMERGLCR